MCADDPLQGAGQGLSGGWEWWQETLAEKLSLRGRLAGSFGWHRKFTDSLFCAQNKGPQNPSQHGRQDALPMNQSPHLRWNPFWVLFNA